MTTILLVDDELAVLRLLEDCCQEAGYQTITATDGQEALRQFFQHHPEMAIVDLRMPGMNGFELISRLREVSQAPIIVLSALGQEEDKVRALRQGADDYVVKPVGMGELLARMEAALRRAQLPASEAKSIYIDGVLTIDLERREVFVREQRVDMTPTEVRLLVYLTQHAGKVISVPDLLTEVWGSPHYSEESVKWHIASLRRKIEENPHEPKLIVNVWGSGYRYDKPSLPQPPKIQ